MARTSNVSWRSFIDFQKPFGALTNGRRGSGAMQKMDFGRFTWPSISKSARYGRRFLAHFLNFWVAASLLDLVLSSLCNGAENCNTSSAWLEDGGWVPYASEIVEATPKAIIFGWQMTLSAGYRGNRSWLEPHNFKVTIKSSLKQKTTCAIKH